MQEVEQCRSNCRELVRRKRGAPGIDGVSIQDFEANLDEELSQLQQELTTWTYQPSPVRRVEIPKPDGKGVRLLGIPTVRDRGGTDNVKAVAGTDL